MRRAGSISNFSTALLEDGSQVQEHLDRVPVRLIFKSKKLETLAEKYLKSRVVMALQSLTIKEFIAEVMNAMNSSKSVR